MILGFEIDACRSGNLEQQCSVLSSTKVFKCAVGYMRYLHIEKYYDKRKGREE
jgi:hypothetical protein